MLLGVLGTNEIIIIILIVVIIIGILISRVGINMKKFFGILFLIIGLVAVGLGIVALTNYSSKNDSFEGRLRDRFNENYHTQNEDQKTGGIVSISVGALFFIIGLIMAASKSNLQRKKEAELEEMKNMQFVRSQPEQKTEPPPIPKLTPTTDDIFNQLERLAKLKEQGFLSDEEFQQQKKKILE
jgi:Short C-terminal domain